MTTIGAWIPRADINEIIVEIDLLGQQATRAYQLLASVVVPRPIAWVTSLNAQGRLNAAPFSFFNVLGPNPPIVGFCPGDREDGTPKDTALNIGIVTTWIALR